MTDDQELQLAAADKLEELDGIITDQESVIADAYKELLRVYEIVAIYHPVIERFFESRPEVPDDPIAQEGFNAIVDARYAVENNTTVDEARLVREEELTE